MSWTVHGRCDRSLLSRPNLFDILEGSAPYPSGPFIGRIIDADYDNVLIVALTRRRQCIPQPACDVEGYAKVASSVVLGRRMQPSPLLLVVQVSLNRNSPAAPAIRLGQQLA
jgi:hypothetical protein